MTTTTSMVSVLCCNTSRQFHAPQFASLFGLLEVVTTGSPQRMNSWSLNHRNRTYANFLNDLCDKAFSVPCWVYLLSTVHASSFRSIQYLCLWWLILTELASGCLRFKAYYGSYAPAPQVEGIELAPHCAIEVSWNDPPMPQIHEARLTHRAYMLLVLHSPNTCKEPRRPWSCWVLPYSSYPIFATLV